MIDGTLIKQLCTFVCSMAAAGTTSRGSTGTADCGGAWHHYPNPTPTPTSFAVFTGPSTAPLPPKHRHHQRCHCLAETRATTACGACPQPPHVSVPSVSRHRLRQTTHLPLRVHGAELQALQAELAAQRHRWKLLNRPQRRRGSLLSNRSRWACSRWRCGSRGYPRAGKQGDAAGGGRMLHNK